MYGPDLAAAHHEGFLHVAEAAATRLITALRAAGHAEGLIVDLGCGTGVVARRAVEAGYAAFGVDVSPYMLRLARENVPTAEFVEDSVIDAAIPPCVGVACVGEVLNYAFDPRAGPVALDAVIWRAARALAPGGLFVLDLAGPGRVRPNPREAVFESPDTVIVLRATEADGRAERRITTFRRDGAGWRRADEVHALVLFDPEHVRCRLDDAGFDVEVADGYGEQRLSSGWTAFEARRRSEA